MALVVLPRALLELFPGAERRVSLEGRTVGELIEGLDARWPGMRDRLCEGRGSGARVRPHLRIVLDGEVASLTTAVADDSLVHVVLSISGG